MSKFIISLFAVAMLLAVVVPAYANGTYKLDTQGWTELNAGDTGVNHTQYSWVDCYFNKISNSANVYINGVAKSVDFGSYTLIGKSYYLPSGSTLYLDGVEGRCRMALNPGSLDKSPYTYNVFVPFASR